MNRRSSFEIALIIFLASVTTLTSTVQLVRAGGTIYIRSDGSIDPPTAPILRSGNLYTFTADIYESIVVQKDLITIDGNGYTIQGSESGNGFDVSSRNDVTIKNAEIRAFGNGIFSQFSTNIKIVGNIISSNSKGIQFWAANVGENITGNTFTGNTVGIEMIDTYESTVTGNNLTNNGKGILLRTGDHNTISMNTIVNNPTGVDLENVRSTAVSGNNISLSSNCGIEIQDSSFVSVLENSIKGNNEGIIIAVNSNDNTISGNSITQNSYGLEVTTLTSNNLLSENEISDNTLGLWLSGGSSNRFYHNNFVNNVEHVEAAAGLGSNSLDDGYPSGGNYWSGYTDVDLFKGPNQDEVGSDGIWDHPYAIAPGNVDRYPFTQRNGWEIPPPPPPPPLPEFPLGSILPFAMMPLLVYLWLKRKQRTSQ